MRIDVYYENPNLIKKDYEKHIKKNNIQKNSISYSLTKAHLDKANHNLRFVAHTFMENEFNDWCVVGLYYTLYHSALSLVTNKGHISKNHTSTLIFLLIHYSDIITLNEIKFIDELLLTKNDAEFYTSLKEKREQASYSTGILFKDEKVKELKEKTINFLNKVKEIVKT